MKTNFLNIQAFILIIFLNIRYTIDISFPSNSYYYEEKYFRILSNNYDSIDPGNFWTIDENDKGPGFVAKRDFGSLILLKDWSMYNFKLTKIIFRSSCTFDYEKDKCHAEMWLIHTKDNGYYPPGRRIFIKQNYFIIVVPFVKAENSNPAIDSIFDLLRLRQFSENLGQNPENNVTPEKPIKLYQIIQNQPSFLFEGKYNEKETLFMVFSQYHFISNENHQILENLYNEKIKLNYGSISVSFDTKTDYPEKIFRNVRNIEEVSQKVTLMSYSKAKYLENILFFIIIFLL